MSSSVMIAEFNSSTIEKIRDKVVVQIKQLQAHLLILKGANNMQSHEALGAETFNTVQNQMENLVALEDIRNSLSSEIYNIQEDVRKKLLSVNEGIENFELPTLAPQVLQVSRKASRKQPS